MMPATIDTIRHAASLSAFAGTSFANKTKERAGAAAAHAAKARTSERENPNGPQCKQETRS